MTLRLPGGRLFRDARALMALGAAYKAKLLCSGVFVARRAPLAVLADDLAAGDPVLRHVRVRLDTVRQAVTASFLGLGRRTAVYHPGLGCTLVHPGYPALPALPPPMPPGTPVTEPAPPDAALTERFQPALDWAFGEPDPERPRRTRAVVILHRGRLAAERYAPGFDQDTPLLGWSLTKSIFNALVGILVGQGQLSLARPLHSPEWRLPGDARQNITLRHLLGMNCGLEFNEDKSEPLADVITMLLGTPDAAGYAASKPLRAEPGSQWRYSSGSTLLISRTLRQVLGDAAYWRFPRQALFEPLGMRSALIEPDAAGTFVASSFMYATARDWARFGQLYLQDGTHDGQRILPPGWVDYTRTPAPRAPQGMYGAHFWLRLPAEYREYPHVDTCPGDAFHAVGHEAQFITILPNRNLVIVRLGLTRHPNAWPHDKFVNQVLAALES